MLLDNKIDLLHMAFVSHMAFVPGLENRVFDKAIVYCVDIR